MPVASVLFIPMPASKFAAQSLPAEFRFELSARFLILKTIQTNNSQPLLFPVCLQSTRRHSIRRRSNNKVHASCKFLRWIGGPPVTSQTRIANQKWPTAVETCRIQPRMVHISAWCLVAVGCLAAHGEFKLLVNLSSRPIANRLAT